MTQDSFELDPKSQYDRQLRDNVQPPGWNNPTPKSFYHLVVIGAGTAGLVAAAGAAGLGAKVALVERSFMGGDCLNTGCVPSKALLRAARAAAEVNQADAFGVRVPGPATVDFAAVMNRMRRLRASISPADSAERFSNLGVDVFLGNGQFVDRKRVAVLAKDGTEAVLNFGKAVIATGASPAKVNIAGIDSVNYLTTESLFSLQELPKRLAIIGAGPVGAEMAQAFARFGSEVHLFSDAEQILSKEDTEAAAVIHQQLQRDGVTIYTRSQSQSVESKEATIRLCGISDGKKYEVEVEQLLIAAGRTPNTTGLNLESVGVEYGKKGVVVDDFLRTSNRRIFAAGDVCSNYKFTHAADFQARAVIQNALFALGPFGRKKVSDLIVPWATYTSPEVAHVGMYPKDAQQAGMEIDTYIQHFGDLDRAVLDGEDRGFVKVHTQKGTDRIVGATIVAEHAGDLISEITLAMNHGIGLSRIGSTIHPYPTQMDAVRKLGDQFNRTRLTAFAKRLLRTLMYWNTGQ